MYLRLVILGALLLLAAPLPAEELQIHFTGVACPEGVACFVQDASPFSVSFDINTLSGSQTYTFGEIGETMCLGQFRATNVAITDFSASVGGQSLGFPSSLLGGVRGDIGGTGSAPCPGFNFGVLGVPGFFWSFDAFKPGGVTQAQFNAFNDPLASLLTSFSDLANTGLLPGWMLSGDVKITPIAVPEPEILSLLALGFVGLWFVPRKQATWSRR